MIETELYERLRKLLSSGEQAIGLPKHEITYKLLTNMYTKEEAKLILSSFKACGIPMTIKKISKNSGMSKEEIMPILEDMSYKGKLMKIGSLFMLLPYLPGGFEVYFTTNRDDPESMKKAAEAHLALFDLGFPYELSSSNYTIYRVIPTIIPIEKEININRSVDIQYQILPYEVLKDYLTNAHPKKYAVVPCSCRNAAKLADHPCKRTDENYCVTTGILAQSVIEQEVGREVSLEKLMEIMEKAEKNGLVHETFNIQDTAIFVCNCCSCCCGFLKSVKELNNYSSITKSNFDPIIDRDKCTLCETCMNICPMDAIYHHWPHKEDLSDDMMRIRLNQCIGCGVCASNCPSEAITLKKVRNIIPYKSQTQMMENLAAGKTH